MTDVQAVPRLHLEHVSKTFGRNVVLDDVGLEVRPGEIHALVGQNGSGKSTLIKVLSGLYVPDPGATILFDGVPVLQPVTPTAVMKLGLTFIHQSLGLIPGHSVTENVRLANLSRRRFGRFIDWGYERRQAVATLDRMNATIDPDRIVDTLHAGQKATVAIARALQIVTPGEGCIVLDESTQSLSREVLPEFYETIRGLAREGTSVVIVSHRLDEVLALADRVTILRDGRVTTSGVDTAGMSEAALSREILGRQLVSFSREEGVRYEQTDASQPVRVRALQGDLVHDIDFDIEAGEVVGITGATESGFEEVPYLLTGTSVASGVAGTLSLGGRERELSGMTVKQSRGDGAVLVPGDRLGQGLAPAETALDNITLPRLPRYTRGGLLRRGRQRGEFDAASAILKITPAIPGLPVGSFSGGNQQKILLGKWLLDDPTLLVLHEPTQAVDVGARADILHAVSATAARGASVLLASIEAQDLALICDRVLVLDHGRIARELRQPFTPDDVLEAVG